MKVVNGKDIGKYPNGTVFAVINDPYYPEYSGDMNINGLNIICGSDGNGHFNGVCHLLNNVDVCDTYIDEDNTNQFWYIPTDTTEYDYYADDWLVVFEKKDIEKIITSLIWAYRGTEDDLDERGESQWKEM